MDKVYLKDLLAALRAELIRFRQWCLLLFLVVSFGVLGLGLLWPKSFTTNAVLFAEVTNIIENLTKGMAEMTKIDRSEQASEIIYTRGMIIAVGKEAGLITKTTPEEEQLRIVGQIRSKIAIKRERNNNHFQVSYSANNPDTSFEVLNAIINVFIADTARKKREESVGAYNFIDAQVQTYRKQLEFAEEKLKEFKSANMDGSEDSVAARITGLRDQIEALKISIEETQARINTIESQLGNEGKYLKAKGQIDDLKQRRLNLNAELQQLLFSYEESYPDIISKRAQIAELDAAIAKLQGTGEVYGSGDQVQNPLYEELRKQLSEANVNLLAEKRRMKSLESLKEKEFERQQRIAASQAQLSELTRDYDVTRKVYEEMLQRKEAARLSMTLDIEGQGVSYRIQEPATFPLKPSGLQFIHFAIIGPILGLLFPLGLLILYVMLDPHFRSARALQMQMPSDIEIIGVVPHFKSPIGERLLKKDMLILLTVSLLAMAAYLAIAIYWKMTRG
jgi:polysaccharide chain length determinant protein (PEP-CTERM system associated)